VEIAWDFGGFMVKFGKLFLVIEVSGGGQILDTKKCKIINLAFLEGHSETDKS